MYPPFYLMIFLSLHFFPHLMLRCEVILLYSETLYRLVHVNNNNNNFKKVFYNTFWTWLNQSELNQFEYISSVYIQRVLTVVYRLYVQEKAKEKASSADPGLALNMSLQQAKELAHQKRSNKRAPQMDWSKRNELFSNLWARVPLSLCLVSSLLLHPIMPLFSVVVSLLNPLAHD